MPHGSEVWPEVYGGSSVYLIVPLDSRLEMVARQWAASSIPWMKSHGQHTLEQITKESTESP